MSAQTVISKIEEKARETASVILEEGKLEAKKVYDEIVSDAKVRADAIKKKAQDNAALLERGRRQSDNQMKSLALLKAKKDALLLARESAKKELLEITDKRFVEIFSKYMSLSDLSGEFTLIPSKEHRALAEKNQKKLEKNVGVSLTISDTDADIVGGFIISSDIYDVDYSLDSILDFIFEENEKAISEILFQKGEI